MTTVDTFTNYQCWDNAQLESMLGLAGFDAGDQTDSFIYATHSPALITLGKNGSLISEKEVLNQFLEKKPDGRNILPILGIPGSGKSHIIRWLRPRIERIDGAFVVYIPRLDTSLRELVEKILDKFAEMGVEVNDLKEKLSRAHLETQKQGSENTVLNRISEKLEEIGLEESDDPLRPGLANELSILIRDEAFRIPLKKEGGVVGRFVTCVMEGGEVNLDGGGFAFSKEDFPRREELEGSLGEHAQNAFTSIAPDDTKSVAADLISEAFDGSIPAIFGLSGGVELASIFREARELLLSENRVLYVLFEDLSGMQGFGRDLLNTFRDPVYESGEKVRCEIHVAMASTEGHYGDVAESIKTLVVDLHGEDRLFAGVDFDALDEQNFSAKLSAFSARYLNAVRVGKKEIERQYKKNSSFEENEWVPNGCTDCIHMDKCHAAFGEVNGVGLYPFNESAISAFSYDWLARDRRIKDGVAQFSPRKLIKNVLYSVLKTAGVELESGGFPPRRLVEEFKLAPHLGPEVVASIHQVEGQDRERIEPLLRFWGGNPSEAHNLHPGVHEAFGIQKVFGKSVDLVPPVCKHGVQKEVCKQPECAAKEPSVEPKKLPSDPLVKALGDWYGGGKLGGGFAGKIIDGLATAVANSVDWHGLGVPVPPPAGTRFIGGRADPFFSKFSFDVEDFKGVTTANTKVARKLTKKDHGSLLLDLSIALTHEKGAIGLGLERYGSLVEFVDDVDDEVSGVIQEFVSSDANDSLVRTLAERLALGGLMAGGEKTDLDSMGLANYVTSEVGEIKSYGAGRWSKLVSILNDERSSQQKEFLNMNRTTQGTFDGGSMLRMGRIIFHLQELATTWEPIVGPLSGQPNVIRLGKKDLTNGIKERLAEVVEAAEALKTLLESDADWEQVKSKITKATTTATQAHIEEEFTEIHRVLDELSGYPPISSYQNLLEGAVSSGATVGEDLLTIGNCEKLNPVELHRLLKKISDIFSQVIRNGKQRLGIEGKDATEPPVTEDAPIGRLETSIQELLLKFEEL